MKYLCEDFEAGDETWSRSREIAVGVETIDTAGANGRCVLPIRREVHRAILFAPLLRRVPAWGHNENFRPGGDDVLEADSKRRRARFTENVEPSRPLDHFRNPVA